LVDKPQGLETTSSEPKGQELVYAARVSLDRSQMQIEDKRVNLSPGMAVTVEIKTGAQHHQLPPLTAHSLQTREFARKIRNQDSA
jgi:hypothetical protein